MLKRRALFAAKVASRHLVVSLLAVTLVALLVFTQWYPAPYYKVAGGVEIFMLVAIVDIICGPLLTAIFCNPAKSRRELVRDIFLVVLIQLSALGYGVVCLYKARPVYLAYEGDRFRLVSAADIELEELIKAKPEYRQLPISGPMLISTRLLTNKDPNYLASVQDAMRGFHPSYKPERWQPYSVSIEAVKAEAKPLTRLLRSAQVSQELRPLADSEAPMGYFPLDSSLGGDWIVVLNLTQGQVVDILPLNGWD